MAVSILKKGKDLTLDRIKEEIKKATKGKPIDHNYVLVYIDYIDGVKSDIVSMMIGDDGKIFIDSDRLHTTWVPFVSIDERIGSMRFYS